MDLHIKHILFLPTVDYFNDTSLTCAEEHTIYGIKGSFASNATKIKEEWKFQEVAYNSKVVFDASGGTVSETSKELVNGQGLVCSLHQSLQAGLLMVGIPMII